MGKKGRKIRFCSLDDSVFDDSDDDTRVYGLDQIDDEPEESELDDENDSCEEREIASEWKEVAAEWKQIAAECKRIGEEWKQKALTAQRSCLINELVRKFDLSHEDATGMLAAKTYDELDLLIKTASVCSSLESFKSFL